MGLLGPNGMPISSSGNVKMKKAPPPKTGPAFGDWAGRDISHGTLPGGGIVQFDLSKLQLSDFRTMRDHYQVNASLAVLSFMQHQSAWHIECSDKRIAEMCESQLRNNWTMLNRSMSTANWAGFSPTVLEWDNDSNSREVVLSKIKDLAPEECVVNWKIEEGWAPPGRTPPKFKTYDGLKQFGQPWPTPVENTFWYPMLMEHGDYYGKKMLRPAFQSWFFSILLHLYANRYYERFGEPTPIGRAPYEESMVVNGEEMSGNEFMLGMLQQLRSRSVVVLPNEKFHDQNGRSQYEYDIQYLESQMRGADFERYMTRLDEEISIGLFTPILLLRTADVGSYNLGVAHMKMYMWMLNAMNDDRKQYIDKYILSKMTDYNFSEKAPRPEIIFKKLGQDSELMIKDLLLALVNAGKVKVNVVELGEMAGMTIEEVEATTAPDAPVVPDTAGADAPATPNPVTDPGTSNRVSLHSQPADVGAIVKEIDNRVRPQIENAFTNGTFGEGFAVNMGFKRRMTKAFTSNMVSRPEDRVEKVYCRMDNWLKDIVTLPADEFGGVEDFMAMFNRILEHEIGASLV